MDDPTTTPAGTPRAACRRAALVAAVAAALAAHQWYQPPAHPTIWRLSEHSRHHFDYNCAVCSGDVAELAAVAVDAILAELANPPGLCPRPGVAGTEPGV